ncbi:MAG: YebC/PmpR family DNA-binding transcriptional regulator [bacterium]
MSGHSKWATIKRAKAKTDAARGKAFTKVIREIAAAARIGGGDPTGNPRLRLAIDKAKSANMPNDNIKRAIEKATGGGEGASIEEVIYEGYGPGGIAIMIECITDNKMRTLNEIRFLFSRNGGNLGESGSVGWMFKKKGVLNFERSSINEDALMADAIDAGAEDIATEESVVTVETAPEKFEQIRNALTAKKYEPATAEITMVPTNTIKLEGEDAQKILKFIDALEENDDVQKVHANFDIPDEIIAADEK